MPKLLTSRKQARQALAECIFESGDFAVAAEKGFKVVRDRLRMLTGHETGSEAFGRGRLFINGDAAPHVDADLQAAVKFLTMAIDFFRNETSQTSMPTSAPDGASFDRRPGDARLADQAKARQQQ